MHLDAACPGRSAEEQQLCVSAGFLRLVLKTASELAHLQSLPSVVDSQALPSPTFKLTCQPDLRLGSGNSCHGGDQTL